jgi:glycosyltransferase involved in cell wall biosynthesis
MLNVHTVVSESIDPAANDQVEKFWILGRKMLYRHSDVVVAQTHHAAEWLTEHCKTKTCIIPNALRPLPEFNRIREYLVVTVARLDNQKGLDVLLQAFAHIATDFPKWRLVILGEGPERQALTALCKQLELTGKVDMPGRVMNVENWLARAGLVVQPSRFEGFPNAVLEAMGMGVAAQALLK